MLHARSKRKSCIVMAAGIWHPGDGPLIRQGSWLHSPAASQQHACVNVVDGRASDGVPEADAAICGAAP